MAHGGAHRNSCTNFHKKFWWKYQSWSWVDCLLVYLLFSSKQLSLMKLQVLPTFCPAVLYFIWFIQRSNQKLSLYHSLLSRCVSIQKGDKSHNTLLRISYSHTAQDQFCITNQRNIMTHYATVLLLVWENRFFQLFQWLFHTSIIHTIKYQF